MFSTLLKEDFPEEYLNIVEHLTPKATVELLDKIQTEPYPVIGKMYFFHTAILICYLNLSVKNVLGTINQIEKGKYEVLKVKILGQQKFQLDSHYQFLELFRDSRNRTVLLEFISDEKGRKSIYESIKFILYFTAKDFYEIISNPEYIDDPVYPLIWSINFLVDGIIMAINDGIKIYNESLGVFFDELGEIIHGFFEQTDSCFGGLENKKMYFKKYEYDKLLLKIKLGSLDAKRESKRSANLSEFRDALDAWGERIDEAKRYAQLRLKS